MTFDLEVLIRGDLFCFEIVTTIIELLVVIVGGGIIAVLSYRRSILDAIWQWTLIDRSPEVIDSRRFIQYELKEGYDVDDIRNNIDNAATKIAPAINAYHHLGMLLKRHYIPVKIFKDNSTGKTIVIIYEKLLPYITKVRQEHNVFYASDFEYLYNKVKIFFN